MANATATLIGVRFSGNQMVKTYSIATGATNTGTCTITVGEKVAGTTTLPQIIGLDPNDTVAVTRDEFAGDTVVITFVTAGLPSVRMIDIFCVNEPEALNSGGLA